MTIWPSSDDVDEKPYPEPEQCQWLTFRGTLEEPPEYCENEPIEGTDKCPRHTDDRDWDAIRDSANEQALENK